MSPGAFGPLTPDFVLTAVETLGLACDGRLLTLNSYENRVYQIGIDGAAPLIAKFYRPQRWTNEAILEEHRFTFELAECDVPVVAPLIHNGESLFEHAGFRFALFPRRGGRAPEPGNLDQLYRLGQLLGRSGQQRQAGITAAQDHQLGGGLSKVGNIVVRDETTGLGPEQVHGLNAEGGAQLRFEARRINRMVLTLHNADGHVLPFGAQLLDHAVKLRHGKR